MNIEFSPLIKEVWSKLEALLQRSIRLLPNVLMCLNDISCAIAKFKYVNKAKLKAKVFLHLKVDPVLKIDFPYQSKSTG